MIEPIDDWQDPRLTDYNDIRRDDVKDPAARTFIAEGRLCVRRLAASGLAIRSALVQRGREDEIASWVGDDVPVYTLAKSAIVKLVGFNFHRGCLAIGLRPHLRAAADIEFADGLPPVALAVPGVSQRDNLGAMIRTSVALGVENVVLDEASADPFSRRAIRCSMATVFRARLSTLTGDFCELSRRGVRTVATTIDSSATPLDEFAWDDRPIVLMMGGEATGLSARHVAAADDRVTLPMRLGTDSLNVSVATAIFLYELVVRLKRPAR